MKKGLGRGLSALLDYDGEPDGQATASEAKNGMPESPGTAAGGVIYMDIRKIEPNQRQPRQYFDEASLTELAESIKAFGVIQPLIVKDCGDHYAIIAGERRFRAARMAKLATLPVIIKDYSEMETLQIALIENIQRQDLTPIEEATCYKRLIEDFFFTQEDIAEKIGKTKNAVANAVRLLELDLRVQQLAAEGQLSASHARVLLTVNDGDLQYECARRIAEEGLSVRGAEHLLAAMQHAEAKTAKKQAEDVPGETEDVWQAYRRAAEDLKTLLGAKVNIHHGKKKGKIEIEYYSPEELDRLLCLFKSLSNAEG